MIHSSDDDFRYQKAVWSFHVCVSVCIVLFVRCLLHESFTFDSGVQQENQDRDARHDRK